jgi:hypothetical protein
MKSRRGFVSNSSTSSFVIIGYLLEEEAAKEIAKKVLGKDKLDEDWKWCGLPSPWSIQEEDTYNSNAKIIIGISPLEIDECGISGEANLIEILEKLSKLDLGYPPNIYGGTFSC